MGGCKEVSGEGDEVDFSDGSGALECEHGRLAHSVTGDAEHTSFDQFLHHGHPP